MKLTFATADQVRSAPDGERFLLVSRRAYWRPDGNGYTCDICCAGIYDRTDALRFLGLGRDVDDGVVLYSQARAAAIRAAEALTAWVSGEVDAQTLPIMYLRAEEIRWPEVSA